jgi:enoyl-CoA hydratase/carnithine racemase
VPGHGGVDREEDIMGEFVRLEVDGAVGTIRLDRPKMNAINGQVTAELREAAEQARDRADVRAVVLYGGERVFAAGADIKEMSTISYAEMLAWGGKLQESLKLVARLPKPVVAAVTGYALGGGFELALTADFRVLGERAKVGVPEISLGVIPGAGGTQRLTRLVGPAKAKGMVFTGRHVGAEEALALGIADRVVPDAEVYDAALEMARSYAEGPAVALRAAKQAVDDGLELDLESALRLETTLFAGLFATEDQRIGMTSFVENGPGKAEFTGR